MKSVHEVKRKERSRKQRENIKKGELRRELCFKWLGLFGLMDVGGNRWKLILVYFHSSWNTWRLVEMDGKENFNLFVSIDLTCISMDFP